MNRSVAFHFDIDDEVIGIFYLSNLKNVLEAHGCVLRGYDGPSSDLSDYRKRISLRTLYQVFSMSVSDAPAGLGIAYGKQLNLVAADAVGQLIMSCKNLGEALDALRRYHTLIALALKVIPLSDGSVSTIRFQGLYSSAVPLRLKWFVSEALFACLQCQARWLTAQTLEYGNICLPYAQPPHHNEYVKTFNCEICYNSPSHAIYFDANYLQKPLVTANKELRNLKKNQCEKALLRWQSRFSITERVNAILIDTYPNFPTLDQVAEKLHSSRSCLYRKLQINQTSYQSLINEFKREQSIRLLQSTAMPVSEVAERLGFSDASSFRRAFKNWTGVQPSSIRCSSNSKDVATTSRV